jgi:UDP:flavonoid glycosyltransferase YjiC (YdhE family)
MGHLNPMIALARKLQSRGHEVVFIGVPDIGPVVRAGGLEFKPFCEIDDLSARRLSELIVTVLEKPNYRDKARWFQKVLGETRGVDVAADVIERVFCPTDSVDRYRPFAASQPA